MLVDDEINEILVQSLPAGVWGTSVGVTNLGCHMLPIQEKWGLVIDWAWRSWFCHMIFWKIMKKNRGFWSDVANFETSFCRRLTPIILSITTMPMHRCTDGWRGNSGATKRYLDGAEIWTVRLVQWKSKRCDCDWCTNCWVKIQGFQQKKHEIWLNTLSFCGWGLWKMWKISSSTLHVSPLYFNDVMPGVLYLLRVSCMCLPWYFNIAMDNGPFSDDLPII